MTRPSPHSAYIPDATLLHAEWKRDRREKTQRWRVLAQAWCPRCHGTLAVALAVADEVILLLPQGRAGSREALAQTLEADGERDAEYPVGLPWSQEIKANGRELLGRAARLREGVESPRLCPRAVNLTTLRASGLVGLSDEEAICGGCGTTRIVVVDVEDPTRLRLG
ncbi:hypothetical protein [Phycicoccus avicenniae]|uniref:hypothetical protein n=1 Tax=Phycicoccus avicenniae TaxID=2828860 RepID=UPI003D2C8C1C